MRRIHLQSTESTVSYARQRIERGELAEGMTLIDAEEQTAGRGQCGNSWESEAGANLTFSIVCHPRFIAPARQFVLSQAMSVAIVRAVEAVRPHGGATEGAPLSVKWPNDIYIGDRKVSGTLIECDLQGKQVETCSIGTGLNVNQATFHSDAPNPVSLRQAYGREFDRETLLAAVADEFEGLYRSLEHGGAAIVRQLYWNRLYRRNGLHGYEDGGGTFRAAIADIEPSGHLVLRREDGTLSRYEFKEVRFII